jgi:hypothetical protein
MAKIILPPVHCTSAQKFLDALSPLGKHFGKDKIGEPWLFRGQGRDEPLIPSLFRKERNKMALLTQRNINDPSQLRLAERDALIEFFNIADKRGLILPDDSQQLRSTIETLQSERGEHFTASGFEGWVTSDITLSLIALAQHYGLPTRLLDWARQSFTAAFFAAESAFAHLSENDPKSCLVVWAFYFPELGKHDDIDRRTDPLRIITAPSATNTNLKAQQGVFTLLNSFYADEGIDNYPSMDQFLSDLAAKVQPLKSGSDSLVAKCRLQKFTLPISESSELLRLLAKLDITPSSIYPGFSSIITDLQMRNHW